MEDNKDKQIEENKKNRIIDLMNQLNDLKAENRRLEKENKSMHKINTKLSESIEEIEKQLTRADS